MCSGDNLVWVEKPVWPKKPPRPLFRVMNRYVPNLPPAPSVFPDHPAPVVERFKRLAARSPSVGNQTQGSPFSLIEPGSTALPTVCRILWFGLSRTGRNRGLQDQTLTIAILQAHHGWLQKRIVMLFGFG